MTVLESVDNQTTDMIDEASYNLDLLVILWKKQLVSHEDRLEI